MPTNTSLERDENAPEIDSATPKLSRREQLEQWLEQRGKARVVTHNATGAPLPVPSDSSVLKRD